MSEYPDYTPETPQDGEGRKRTPATRREERTTNLFIGGMMIAIGLVFFLQQLGVFAGDFAWWALFILIPGFYLLGLTVHGYRQTGRVEGGLAVGGLASIVVALVFLLELDWGLIWPIFIIIPGVAFMLGWFDDEDEE